MPNDHVKQRLAAIQKILVEAFAGGGSMSAATKGSEREAFVDLVLSNLIPPLYRVGTGEITDHEGRLSGQLDVVIEYTSSISFPLLKSDNVRLYLAGGVAAVIEVKSDLSKTWNDVLQKGAALSELRAERGVIAHTGVNPGHRIPFFVVGYKGWADERTVAGKLSEANRDKHLLDGILVVERGFYKGANQFSGHGRNGESAIFGFLLSIEEIFSTLHFAKPQYSKFVE